MVLHIESNWRALSWRTLIYVGTNYSHELTQIDVADGSLKSGSRGLRSHSESTFLFKEIPGSPTYVFTCTLLTRT